MPYDIIAIDGAVTFEDTIAGGVQSLPNNQYRATYLSGNTDKIDILASDNQQANKILTLFQVSDVNSITDNRTGGGGVIAVPVTLRLIYDTINPFFFRKLIGGGGGSGITGTPDSIIKFGALGTQEETDEIKIVGTEAQIKTVLKILDGGQIEAERNGFTITFIENLLGSDYTIYGKGSEGFIFVDGGYVGCVIGGLNRWFVDPDLLVMGLHEDYDFDLFGASGNNTKILRGTPITPIEITLPSTTGSIALISDITGGVFTPVINSNAMVEVAQFSDFGTIDINGDITLAGNTTFFIRGTVNCSGRLFITNPGTSIRGWDRDTSRVAYTGLAGAGDFITIIDVNCELIGVSFGSTNATPGDVLLRAKNYDYFQSVPPIYDAFNLGRNKVLTIINCQFRNCFDVSHIEGFDLVDIQNTLFIYIEATTMGCHFKNVSKLQISSCEYVRWFDETSIPTPSGYATTPLIEFLENGLGNGFGAVNISGSIFHPQQTQDGINISDLATVGFGTISANTGIDIGLTTGVVTNIDYDIQNSIIIQANQKIQNGNAKGILSLSGNLIDLDTSNAPLVGGLYSLPIADASFIGGVGPTNAITFPVAQRVTTSSANGSFTYNSKIDGNFNVNLNATVTVQVNGTYYVQLQFRQNGTPLPLIAKVTIRNSGGIYSGRPIGLSIQGTATQGDVFDVLVSCESADDVFVSELIVNGYQF